MTWKQRKTGLLIPEKSVVHDDGSRMNGAIVDTGTTTQIINGKNLQFPEVAILDRSLSIYDTFGQLSVLKFDSSGIAPGTTRLVKAQDKSGVLGMHDGSMTPAMHGYRSGWTHDPLMNFQGQGLIWGYIFFSVFVALRPTISTIHHGLYVAGANLTNCYVGLYDKNLNRLVTSTDQSSNWSGGSPRHVSTSIPTTTVTVGEYYVMALLANSTSGNTYPAMINPIGGYAYGHAYTHSSTGLIRGGLDNSHVGATSLPATIGPSLTLNTTIWGGFDE